MGDATTTVVGPHEQRQLTPDELVDRYVRLRDKIAEIKKQQTDALTPYNEMLERIGNMLLDILDTNKAKSLRTENGTFFKSIRTSAKVTDWQQTLAFIREREAWDLLEHRVSKLAAEAIIEETKEPIPGVEVSRENVINVRRS